MRHKWHHHQTRACRGSPERCPQCANICGLVLRPRRSRSGETRGGASKEYIEGANYLGKGEVSLVSDAPASMVVKVG